MATKLSLFNGALVALGHRRLSDTGEDNAAGRELNAVYDHVVQECLSVGHWNHAMETIKAEADTGVAPAFGYTEVFVKPTDWVRTSAVSADENFSLPLLQYYDDDTFWSANQSPIYIRYVSDDTGLGLCLSGWPPLFTRYVELELAERVFIALTQDASREDRIWKKRNEARKRALNVDAMNEAQPKFAPPGSWTQARGGQTSRGDRGSRGGLVG